MSVHLKWLVEIYDGDALKTSDPYPDVYYDFLMAYDVLRRRILYGSRNYAE